MSSGKFSDAGAFLKAYVLGTQSIGEEAPGVAYAFLILFPYNKT